MLSIKLLLSLPLVSLNTSVAKKKKNKKQQRNKQKLYHDLFTQPYRSKNNKSS